MLVDSCMRWSTSASLYNKIRVSTSNLNKLNLGLEFCFGKKPNIDKKRCIYRYYKK